MRLSPLIGDGAGWQMSFKIPQQSVFYLLICGTGLLIFILGGIVPSQRTLRTLDGKIAATKVGIEEQKALISIYQTLKQRSEVQRTQSPGVRPLPLPVKTGQVGIDLDQLTDAVKAISRTAKLEMISLVPALNSLEGNSKAIVVEAAVRGELSSCRQFLISMGGLPYVEQIEELQFHQQPEGTEMRIKFWFYRL